MANEEAREKVRFSLDDAFLFLDRIEDQEAKKELRNILSRIVIYVEKI